jgi:hypothetical protein
MLNRLIIEPLAFRSTIKLNLCADPNKFILFLVIPAIKQLFSSPGVHHVDLAVLGHVHDSAILALATRRHPKT